MMSSATVTAPLADCTAFQIDLLLALTATYESGTAVRERLLKRHDEINHAQLYTNLDTLAERGLVSKARKHFDERTNGYRLTDVGQANVDLYARYVRAHVDGGGA